MSLAHGLTLRRLALAQAARLLARRPGASVLAGLLAAVCLTALLAIVAAVPAGLAAWRGVQQLNRAEAVIFLTPSTSAAEARGLAQRLASQQGVAEAQVKTREAALSELLARSGGNSKAVGALRVNPLPDAIVVRFDSAAPSAWVETQMAAVRGWPGVELVHHDAAWQRRLSRASQVALTAAGAVSAVAGLAWLLALAAAVRLVGGLDPQEARLMHLAGADRATLRRPAMYSGAVVLAAGAAAAVAVVLLLQPYLLDALQVLQLPAPLWNLPLPGAAALALFVAAAALAGAILGAWASRGALPSKM